MPMPIRTIRTALTIALDDFSSSVGRSVNVAIALLTLISASIFIAETYPLGDVFRHNLMVLNGAILLVFALEYALRLWCAEDKWGYVTSLYAVIDLVALLPFFLGLFDVSYLLILRWFRVLKLLRVISGKSFFGYLTTDDSIILTRILFTLFAIVFVYSGMIYQVEHPLNPNLRTFLDALYFAVATMTTVGFGDITPISEGGRLLTILMIWTGIGLIPWQVGNLVKHLFESSTKVKTPCPTCGLSFHDDDARFCRACGTSLSPSLSPPLVSANPRATDES